MSGDHDNKYFIVVHHKAKCMSCKKPLEPENIAEFPPFLLVHRYHFDGYHMNCIPRLKNAELRLKRIKEEYGIEITLEIGEDDEDG